MSGAPAHSSRFIAYSGEVCRNPTGEPSLRRDPSDSRCTSVTAARTSAGSRPRARRCAGNGSRTTPSSRARSRNVSSAAVGRHEPGAGWFIPERASAWPRRSVLAGTEPLGETACAIAEQHDHRRAHVETAEFGAAGKCGAETLVDAAHHTAALAGRVDLAGEHRLDAADEQRTHHHHRQRAEVGVELADHALVAREQARHGARSCGVHAVQLAWHVARRARAARPAACGCGGSCTAPGRCRRSRRRRSGGRRLRRRAARRRCSARPWPAAAARRAPCRAGSAYRPLATRGRARRQRAAARLRRNSRVKNALNDG